MSERVILLIATETTVCNAVRSAVDPIDGLRVEMVADLSLARSRLEGDDVVLTVFHLSTAASFEGVAQFVRGIAAAPRPMPVLVLSDRYDAEQALEVLRLGAVDYLCRPFDLNRIGYLADMLTVRTRLGARQKASASQPRDGIQRLGDKDPFLCAPGADAGKQMCQVQAVAPLNTTVLLTGETGTGKTRLARLIHELSPRISAPFVAINCGALSATLIESEMFGHCRGAFTGADRDRTGKFEDAGDGTLLLDEVDSLPPSLQVKLLRAVEERVFEPVGSNQSRPLKARLIAASNRKLEEEVVAGRFRSDLYYRLNVVGFALAPLRERKWMIEPLANQCLLDFSARKGCKPPALCDFVLQALNDYHWPGNIRELRNVIERAVALCSGPEIQLGDLPETVRQVNSPHTTLCVAGAVGRPASLATRALPTRLAATRREVESARITEALGRHGNNRLRAAAELGISRMTLYNKLHKYGLIGAA
ncbi:MAG TPA: sigma-54 dependent transcriptional regulator [Isosphaeraceae bacterium]|nr:sigma-54 dependent transcriptional regulator [Isosphaeraceae bacterium]